MTLLGHHIYFICLGSDYQNISEGVSGDFNDQHIFHDSIKQTVTIGRAGRELGYIHERMKDNTTDVV